MGFKEITEENVKGKKVLVRVDYDVPMKNGKVVSGGRIKASLDTLKYLLSGGAAVILCSHLDRPGGKKKKELSLKVVAKELEKLIGTKVAFVSDCIGPRRDKAVGKAKSGDVVLLENVRFHKEEEENNPKFAGKLTRGCDLFVNDAFPAAHRNHTSIVGVTKILPSYAGINLAKEVKVLTETFENPKKPLVAVIGGAKISTKIEVLKALSQKVDVLILGGGMAITFAAGEGYEVGNSLFEEEFLDEADNVRREAEDNGVEVLLPDDFMAAKSTSEGAKPIAKAIDEIDKTDIIVDIGPRSISKFSEPLKFAGTIFWNGPVGIAEIKNFAGGTKAIANIIADSGAKSIIGGGDTAAAVADENLKFDFVSSGGGATLAFISGEKLPGIEALKQ